jgi:hypothetical protein
VENTVVLRAVPNVMAHSASTWLVDSCKPIANQRIQIQYKNCGIELRNKYSNHMNLYSVTCSEKEDGLLVLLQLEVNCIKKYFYVKCLLTCTSFRWYMYNMNILDSSVNTVTSLRFGRPRDLGLGLANGKRIFSPRKALHRPLTNQSSYTRGIEGSLIWD